MAAPLQGNSFYFWVLGCVALSPFVPLWLPFLNAGAAAPSPLSHLGSAGACAQVGGSAQRALGAWGSGEGSQGGGEGPGADLRAQPCSSGMVLRDGDGRWQMPGIAGVFLALSFVREGTRNISCPGRHRG